MRWIAFLLSALMLFASAAPGGTSADAGRAALILDRLHNANRWRAHVMVVSHRAGWKENGEIRMAENSRAAIEYAISVGAEMVELDVRKSADGHLIVMHDSWLDRTTTCHGEVDRFTLAELRTCRLVVEKSKTATAETVPALTEMLTLAKGRILVNIDNKLEPEVLAEIATEARRLGMAGGILVKTAVWNAARITMAGSLMKTVGADVPFMPILADDAVSDARFMTLAARTLKAPAAELVHWHADGAPLTERGGALFSTKARAAAIKGNWHLWVNTYPIVNREPGLLSGGRGDELAWRDGRPEESWGFWIDRGATIIQTDEPKLAIEWLEKNGYRLPYDLTN